VEFPVGRLGRLLEALNVLISLTVFTFVFAMMYRFLPRVGIDWRDVWTGAGITALLFVIGKFLIGFYIGNAGVTARFGAAGALVALLLWVYYSAQIFLLGAEFTWLYANRSRSHAGKAERARPVT
jgi:membrane protein